MVLRFARLTAMVLVCGLIGEARAQGRTAPIAVRDISVRFEHLTVAQGLSQTTIYAIFQDRDGFMWFATQDGLNRYDGHSMKVYRHVPFDSTALGDNTVVSITEDRQGYLWIGSGRGLHRMNPRSETFKAFRNDPNDPNSLGNDVVRHALEDRNGMLWVATENGLDRFDRDTGAFTHFRHDPSDSSSLSHSDISWIYEDLGGHLWVTANNGLNRLRSDGSGFDHFLTHELNASTMAPADYFARRVLERPEEPGTLWVGTGRGLVRLDPETGQTEVFSPTADPGQARVPDLVQDPIATHVLWLPVPGAGLGRFDIRTGAFSTYGPDPGDPQSLATTNTERVFVDRSGMLWVGVNGFGVDRFNPGTIGMSHFRYDPNSPSGLPGAHVRGLYQERDGALWVGTTDRQGVSHLSRFDPGTRTFQHLEHDERDPQSLGDGRIRAVLVDKEGSVWVGVQRAGLHRMLPGRVGKFQHFAHDKDDPTSISHNVVRYLLEDRSGTIWVATNGGLDRLVSADEGTFFRYRHDPADGRTLTSNRTSVLFESRAGFIWVGADGGLNRLDPLTGAATRYQHDESDPSSLSSDAILSINERSREPGVIWIGTFGGGLNRLDVASGQFTHFTEQDGLPNNTVYGILEDEQGRLWLSTNVGLARFDPDSETFRSYGLDVGLQSLEFNSAASHKGLYGEMFFGGVNGFNAFFPDELTENIHPPEVVIVDVKLSNHSVKGVSDAWGLDGMAGLGEMQVGPDDHDISFDYVALHFQNPSQNRYQYRLDGHNDDWIDAGGRRTASYTNLAPGRYTFRVRAANSDGVWNEEGAAMTITVAPPWWRTWWAFAIYAVMLIGVVLGVHRIQSDRLVRAERERSRERTLDDARTIQAAYNHLKATQEQLVQAEKMASLGHLTAGIAHEIKNPLNFVTNFTELSREALDEMNEQFERHRDKLPNDVAEEFSNILKTVRANTERVREHGRRADVVVKNMLRHSQSRKSERHPTDLGSLLREYASLVQRSFEAKYPDMVVEIDGDYDASLGRVNVVPQDIGRVFMNLLNNAFESLHDRSLSEGPSFEPRVSLSIRRLPGVIDIRISDNGTGISAQVRDKIFDPFFTTREAGQGAGLGLSMSYEIIAAHGGALRLDDENDEGATFVIHLPN